MNIGGTVEVNKGVVEALAGNIGLAGTVTGVAGAVAKCIAKSSLPCVQKAGITVIASGVAEAGIYIINLNLNKVISSNKTNGSYCS